MRTGSAILYVGTYTTGKSKGIYFFRLQPPVNETSQNVTLVAEGLAAEAPNPSFLEIDAKRRLLYAVNEQSEFQGKPGGGVSAFSIEPGGKLTTLNQRNSMGTVPCHLVLDRTGRNLLVANYGNGTAAVFRIEADGKIGDPTSVVQHSGRSVDERRQQGPHAHCVTFDPAERFAFVCDLGLDKVMAYRFDARQGKLTPNDPPFAQLKAGAGPRHMAFRPDGRFAYVINELNSTVTAFAYDPEAGALKAIQTVSTLPGSFHGASTCAEVEVHPSGNFLYGSNRGNETVVLFAIDRDKGTLQWVEEQGTGGLTPRHFGIEPWGQHMVIANQDSDTLLPARIDPGCGRLKPSGIFTRTPSPVCVKFLPCRL